MLGCGGWGVSAFRILWALWLRGILCSKGSRVLEGFRVWGGVNIWALTISYTILGVPSFNYRIMGQNPILIIKASILCLQFSADCGPPGRGGCCQPLIRFQEVL